MTVGAWREQVALCDNTEEKMESFVGELAAILILVFLAGDGAMCISIISG